jgi:hypothetical protein
MNININPSTIEEAPVPELKTSDKTKYMREYKRKQYQTKSEDIKNKNKAYYYKYKHNLSNEDMKKYDIHLPLIARIRKNLDELKETKPEFVQDILNQYLE